MKTKQTHHNPLRKVVSTSVLLAAFLFLLVTGCSDSSFNPLTPQHKKKKPTPPGVHNAILGLVEISISGIGTRKMVATASPGMRHVATTIKRLPTGNGQDGSIQLKSISNGSFTLGGRDPGDDGYRYIYATFKVRNADAGGVPYTTDLTNLTFIAVDTNPPSEENDAAETYGRTTVSVLRLFNGDELSITDPAAIFLAGQIIPTGRVTHIAGDPDELRVVRTDVLQVLTETEAGNLEASVSGKVNDVFPYGFVVRTPDVTPGSRTMPNLTNDNRPGTDQYDGLVTFAFKIPLQAQASEDPFEITMMFLAVVDSQTRITQSPQTRSADALNKFAARALAISAKKVSAFPASRYNGSISVRTFCTVRVSGSKTNPAAVIGTDCSLNTWTGNTSTNWGIADNWDTGLPSFASPVLIPRGVANAPVLSVDDTVSAMTIQGTPLTIDGHTLTISGLPSKLYR